MVRYWVIAPYNYGDQDAFDTSWNYDLANGVIAIGWSGLGNLSGLSKEDISDRFLEHTDWEPNGRH